MKNVKIKLAMTEFDLRQWELARLMGIHEGTLSRMLRNELPEEEQMKIVDLIQQHAREGQNNDKRTCSKSAFNHC